MAGLNRMGLNRQADGTGKWMENGQDGCISGQLPPKEKRKPGRIYENACRDGKQYYNNCDLLPNGTKGNCSTGIFLLDDRKNPSITDDRKKIFN